MFYIIGFYNAVEIRTKEAPYVVIKLDFEQSGYDSK